jgi:hypothetical protein
MMDPFEGEVLAFLQQLVGQQQAQAQQATLDTLLALGNAILTQVNASIQILTNATYGLAALRSQLDLNAALATIQYNDLVARLALVQEAGHAVTLPAAPPAGFFGAGAGEVWQYVEPGDSFTEGQNATAAGWFSRQLAAASAGNFYSSYWPGYGVSGEWSNTSEPTLSGAGLPILDPSTILSTDADLIAWFNRTNPGVFTPPWSVDGTGHINWVQPGSSWVFTLLFGQSDFAQWQADHAAISKPSAPVWPGLANVTLGGITVLATGLTVTTPMDGVIIKLTGVPTLRGHYDYDGLAGWLNVGALTFLSDGGEAEFYQSLSFTDQVYTPRNMVRAAAVKIRTAPGIVGTVQPWTIT